MGKYMRKSNSTNNGAIELKRSNLGVRTRAKTLALLNQSPPSSVAAPTNSSGFGYLQLRSRRLIRLKPPLYKQPRRLNHINNEGNHVNKRGREGEERGNPNLRNSASSSPGNSRVRDDSLRSGERFGGMCWNRENYGEDFDAYYGENVVDSDPKERSTRESTPSNLIWDPDEIDAPGSTTHPACLAEVSRRLRSSTQRNLPTSHEMEEFFANAEERQQLEFIDKYNFDPVNDKPLPGRYEWERVKP